MLHSLDILQEASNDQLQATQWLALHLFSLYLQCLDVAVDALNCLLGSLKHILSVHLVLRHLGGGGEGGGDGKQSAHVTALLTSSPSYGWKAKGFGGVKGPGFSERK